MIEKEIVTQLAEEQLAFSDCYLVDVTIKPGNLIVIEIDHDTAVGIDDCVALSRYIEERIDRDIEDYELEVGSAGIGTPFKIVRQYIKNVGNEVEVLLKSGIKLKGILMEADENGITIENRGNRGSRGNRENGKIKKTREQSSIPDSYDLTVLRSYDLKNEVAQTYKYDEIKYTKNIIRFK